LGFSSFKPCDCTDVHADTWIVRRKRETQSGGHATTARVTIDFNEIAIFTTPAFGIPYDLHVNGSTKRGNRIKNA
jgi:hypothetical protein